MALEIRRVTAGNLDMAAFIAHNLANTPPAPSMPRDYLQKFLTDESTYLLAALSGANIIGYAVAYRFPSFFEARSLAYLYDIEVLPAFRRKGAGRLLIHLLLDYLKKDNVGELWLGTATGNVEAQALFAATGGIRSGETFNDYTYTLD